jgi:MFS family permease
MAPQAHGERRAQAKAAGVRWSADPSGLSGLRITALLIFTQLPGVLAYTIPLPLLAAMAKELSHDAAGAYLVKLISGSIGPSMALGSLVGGWLADRFDRRWLVMTLGLLYVLSALTPYVLESLDVIVATRPWVGATSGALMAIGFTMVGDYLPEHKRAGTIGMLSALNMVTALVSLPAAGFVGEAGWRSAFLLYLTIVPVIVLASPSPLPAPAKPAQATSEQRARQRRRRDLPWGLLLLALATGIILTIPGIYVSFHLDTMGVHKTSTVAIIMMGNSLMATIFSALFGKAAKRFSWKLIFSIAFSTMGVGLVMLAFARGIGVAIPALLLMGAGMGWLAPGIPAKAVASVEEGRRGTVVGAVQGASASAPLIGISLLEPLHIGTMVVMLLVGTLSIGLFLGFALSPSDRLAKG